ncbi:MAG: His/Gly/Thr/Pro-type tRNA ligase C-terminal domain-containing protein [Cyclobacteriaceae bacterium]
MDQETMMYGLGVLKELRRDGIYAEIYPDHVKLKKQLDYANKKNVPFVIVIGSEEMKSGKLTFKNMQTGEQQQLKLEEIIIQF